MAWRHKEPRVSHGFLLNLSSPSDAFMRHNIDLTVVGSDNGLSPGRRQAIIWTNDGNC